MNTLNIYKMVADIKDKKITFRVETFVIVIITLISFFCTAAAVITHSNEAIDNHEERISELEDDNELTKIEYAKISTQLANIDANLIELKQKLS